MQIEGNTRKTVILIFQLKAMHITIDLNNTKDVNIFYYTLLKAGEIFIPHFIHHLNLITFILLLIFSFPFPFLFPFHFSFSFCSFSSPFCFIELVSLSLI